MTLNEIIKKCNTLSIDEERTVSDDYIELVFCNKELNEWNRIFTEILGPAQKPTGTKPTKDDVDLAKGFGGVYDNQTLFKKEFGDYAVLAMFWPWKDGIHTTLKVVLIKKSKFKELLKKWMTYKIRKKTF